MSELEKYKLMLFMVVRNNKVLPVGLEKGKTQKEIEKEVNFYIIERNNLYKELKRGV